MGQKRKAPEHFDVEAAILSGKIGAVAATVTVISGRNSLEGLTRTKGKCGRMDISKIRECSNILMKLMDHPFGWVFNQPVDPVGLNIPDYFSIISKPMDLGTIKRKLASKLYSSSQQFAADVRLTFANAMQYNPPGNDVHTMAKELDKIFNLAWKSLEGQWRRPNSNLAQQAMVNNQIQTISFLRPASVKRPSGDAKVKSVPSSAPADATCASKRCRFSLNGNSTQQFPDGEQHSVSSDLEHIKASSEVRLCDTSCELEGNNDLSFEKPLSPTKALRAAILKSRFADTIVKAQEKALLDHVKEIDRAKLQLEREKLERKQKEEKARIEAQLSAAKVSVQKKADEMKMQRKRQREAARLALQRLEKTVEIDNSEMVIAELNGMLVNFMCGDDTHSSPANPLEQLGLFLLNDDLNDEDDEWTSVVKNRDAEEGEISCRQSGSKT